MKSSETHNTLFSQVTLNHGDISLLGRAMLAAEEFCRASGVTLSFSTPESFLAANIANRASWLPVASIFNPQFSSLSEENSFFILGKNSLGETVACQACRFFDWSETNFKEECESLRLWYDEPGKKMKRGERAIVTSLAAKGTTGKIAYSGGAWYRPDFRGKGLVEHLPRLSRAYAQARWDTESTITLMAENNVKKSVFPRNGYRNIEWSVDVINNQSGSIRFAYIWTKSLEMEQDLHQYLADLSTNSSQLPLSAVR